MVFSNERHLQTIYLCQGKRQIGGQTGSNIQDQMLTEHKRATRNGDVNNHIAEHHLQTKHQID